MADIPTVDGLTAEFLTNALRRADVLGGGRVVGMRRSAIEEQGQTGEVVKLQLEFEGDGGDAPRSLVAKAPPPHQAIHAQMHGLGLYEREVRFYQHFGQGPGISVPRCYFADVDTTSGNFLLLLEDMSECRTGDFWRSAPDDVATAIDALAPMHARWWCSDALRQAAWLPQHDDHDYTQGALGAALRRALPVARARHGERFERPLGRFADALVEHWDGLQAHHRDRVFSLVHSDYHPKQMFFPTKDGGRFAVFDWQSVVAGAPAGDLARILFMGLRPDVLRVHRGAMLERYLDGLSAEGIDYPADKLAQDLKAGLCKTLFITIFASAASDTDILERAGAERGIDYRTRLFDDLAEVLEEWGVDEALR